MVNGIIATYQQEDSGQLLVDPAIGSVAFGSGKECWAFTCTRFARIFASKFKVDAIKF
jgi:elongation factor 2